MKLEIKPIFEWRGDELYVGEYSFGRVEEYPEHYGIQTNHEFRGGFSQKSDAQKYMESLAIININYLLHDAQYEVSE